MHALADAPAISTGTALVVSAGLTAALVALHLLAPVLRRLPQLPEAATASVAGGIAVAYVFLHLLPELVEGQTDVGELLEDVVEPTPLLELGVFAVALAGFMLFYGLERLADRRAPRSQEGGSSDGGGGLYALHLASFAVYNGLITYGLALRVRVGLAFAVLFAVAMALHFVLTDRGLQEHYGRRFTRTGRFVLAGALVAGWALSAAFAPTSTVVVTLLTALLAGSVLLNVFKEELPSAARSRFAWFLAGTAAYGGLLAVITAVQEG